MVTRLRPCFTCILGTLLRYRKCGRSSGRSNFAIIALIAWGLLFGFESFRPPVANSQGSGYSTGPMQSTTGPTQAGASFIPAFSVSERYDSNIWFAPATLLPPGTQLHDFATTAQASVKGLYKDKNIDGSLTGGIDGNVYAHNTSLNYFSTRMDMYGNLNGWAERLVKRAQLRFYDYFRYTPQSPGFLSGGKTGTEDPFLRGIQSFRANTFSNTLHTDGVLPIFRDLSAQASYAFSIFRVGSPIQTTASGAIAFFDTIMHSWTAGPNLRVSRTDSVALLYQQNLISQQQSQTSTGQTTKTNTQSVTANYYRVLPNWQFYIGGGVTLIEPASKSFPTGSITIANSPERSTTVQLTLSRVAAPSFYISAGANISNLAQLQVTHRYTKLLTLRGSVNLGYNQTIPTSTNTTFTNFTVSAGANYRLSRTTSIDLYYDHNDFSTNSPGISYVVLRDAVGIALTMEWK